MAVAIATTAAVDYNKFTNSAHTAHYIKNKMPRYR